MSEVVIVDYGSQYTQLILHNFIYTLEAHAELIPASEFNPGNLSQSTKLLILSGSHGSVIDDDKEGKLNWMKKFPGYILGICYGAQMIAKSFGYQFEEGTSKEFGSTQIIQYPDSDFKNCLPATFNVWMSHHDKIIIPEDYNSSSLIFHAGSSSANPVIWTSPNGRQIGLQFHPEVSHTEYGMKLLDSIARLANVSFTYQSVDMIEHLQNKIRNAVGSRKVFLAISGGVDSSTLGILLATCVENLTCIIIDNGLMRKNEVDYVMDYLSDTHLRPHLVRIDAQSRFITSLTGVSDPEEKRHIIGRLFSEVLGDHIKLAGGTSEDFLAQGTIYPDVVESGVGGSQKIKSHHNVGGMPDEFPYKILEPFRHLFKDDVRKIADTLHLPTEIIDRHPFPGPGLSIRIIGEITEEKIKLLQNADAILIDQLKKKNLYGKIWQAGVILLPFKTVGVRGDQRSYLDVVSIRLVESVNGMTANIAKISTTDLEDIANQITNQVDQIGRVLYDISGKPPATIEYE